MCHKRSNGSQGHPVLQEHLLRWQVADVDVLYQGKSLGTCIVLPNVATLLVWFTVEASKWHSSPSIRGRFTFTQILISVSWYVFFKVCIWRKWVQNLIWVAREIQWLFDSEFLQLLCSSRGRVPLFPWRCQLWWRLFYYRVLSAGILFRPNYSLLFSR